MIRWGEPFSELVTLRQAMDKLLEDSFVRPSRFLAGFAEAGAPAIDAYQTANEVVVKASVPGVKPEDINIEITGDTLTVKGESKVAEEVKKENYFFQERRYGSFARSLNLPGGIQADKAEAKLENGLLTITVPKAEEVKPKVIKVKAEGKK
jgi:HSP20 family protein